MCEKGCNHHELCEGYWTDGRAETTCPLQTVEKCVRRKTRLDALSGSSSLRMEAEPMGSVYTATCDGVLSDSSEGRVLSDTNVIDRQTIDQP